MSIQLLEKTIRSRLHNKVGGRIALGFTSLSRGHEEKHRKLGSTKRGCKKKKPKHTKRKLHSKIFGFSFQVPVTKQKTNSTQLTNAKPRPKLFHKHEGLVAMHPPVQQRHRKTLRKQQDIKAACLYERKELLL